MSEQEAPSPPSLETAVLADTTTTAVVKPVLTREDSLDLEEDVVLPKDDDVDDVEDEQEKLQAALDHANLPPGRMHAVKGHQRLHGSSGNLNYNYNNAGGGDSSGSNTPTARRSRSPSRERTGTTYDANSSISSMEELDILTDRAAFDDLSDSQRKLHGSKGGGVLHLPVTINERMTEDTELDVLAFSDCTPGVSRSSNASRVSGNTDREGILEPLDEVEEDYDTDGGSSGNGNNDGGLNNSGGDGTGDGEKLLAATTVILTNMENLHIDSNNTTDSMDGGDGGGSSAAAADLSATGREEEED